MQKYVPVVSKGGKALMPTTNKKADKLIAGGRALRRFRKGLFYIQLVDREDGYVQEIAVGVDPGSKKEGYTVKSGTHTYLNLQADAVTWVKDAVKTRREMSRSRRQRKTPYRKCRWNRKRNKSFIAPSTKARWQWKLRICSWLKKLYPVTFFIVEDIKAESMKGKRRWNRSFSPLQVGKAWFYNELEKLGKLVTKRGQQTKALRDQLGLVKTTKKMAEVFEAHCIDSWVLAFSQVGGCTKPDNTTLCFLTPLQLHRRQLHALQPDKNGNRRPYGGTRSLGFKRGSLVQHKKYGICQVGGTSKGCISLNDRKTGSRLCQNAKLQDVTFLNYQSWRLRPA